MKQVRLLHNPTKIGVLTGQERFNSGRKYLHVLFPSGREWKPEDQLEEVPMNEAPIDLLDQNKFGTPTDLRRILVHTKVSGKLADVLYSMETTDTEFYSYQFKPVLKILDSPSNSILIADEVGLGKTIEAGLIWTELRMRHDFKSLMILCPAALREKWQMELSKRFGVDAIICSAKEALEVLQDPSRRRRGFAIIASLQGLRPSKGYHQEENNSNQAELARYLESKEHEEPIVDLLIIDEAHHMRNRETQTRKLGQLINGVSDYCVFLTATPVHNKNEDLYSLLELLDPATFTDFHAFDNILTANGPLIKARDLVLRNQIDAQVLLQTLEGAKDHHILSSNHQLKNIISTIKDSGNISSHKVRSQLAYNLESVNLLANVVTRTRKREVTEWNVIREPIPEFVSLTEYEREYYDFITSIVIEYAQQLDVSEGFLLASPQRQITSSIPASLERWMYKWSENDNEDKEVRPLVDTILRKLAHRNNPFDIEKLKADDTKYKRLKEVVKEILYDNSNEKIILFSTFRSTLFYLSERLKNDGISSIVMVGGQLISKDETIRKFSKQGGSSVLLSSEVGSEGVDMQFSRIVINYDLPWNPMKVEQRIGRIDRLGQNADKIFIWNILYDQTIDARIYKRLYEKLDLCRFALGDFEEVLGDEIRKLELDLFTGNLSPEEEEKRIDQTAQALENLRQNEALLEEQSSNLVAYGDFILNQIHTARALQRWITPDDLRQYITDYISVNYQGSRIEFVGPDSHTFNIQLSDEARRDFMNFLQDKNLMGIVSNFYYNQAIKCRFENKVTVQNKGQVEIINQFHPLIKWVSHKISKDTTNLRPAVAIELQKKYLEDEYQEGLYLICINKWMFDGFRKLEKLEFRGMHLDTQSELDPRSAEVLSTQAGLQGKYWRESKFKTTDIDLRSIADLLIAQMDHSYNDFVLEQKAKNDDRLQIQASNLHENYERKFDSLKNVKSTLLAKGNHSLVKATDGRIAALKSRTKVLLDQIEEKKKIKTENESISIALINLTEHDTIS